MVRSTPPANRYMQILIGKVFLLLFVHKKKTLLVPPPIDFTFYDSGQTLSAGPTRSAKRAPSKPAGEAIDLFRQQRAHERALIPDHASALVSDAVRLHELVINSEERAILFVGCQALKAEKRESSIARSLGRQKIPVVAAAMFADQINPCSRKLLERGNLRRVDLIVHNARDHSSLLNDVRDNYLGSR